jgi:HEAT repeat protein
MSFTPRSTLVHRSVLVGVAVLALVLVPGFLDTHREPCYGGLTLSKWLQDTYNGAEVEARVAVQAMGTNAIPFLLDQLRKQRSPVKATIVSAAERLGIELYSWKYNVLQANWRGMTGFRLLGPAGGSAAPEVAKLLLRPETRDLAASALSAMEPEGLVELMRALTNRDSGIRLVVSRELGELLAAPLPPEAGSRFVLPAPTRGSQTDIVTFASTRVVPALMASLTDPDSAVRRQVVISLRQLGVQREAVIEAVRHLLQDEDSEVRREVQLTIQESSSLTGDK